MGWLHLFNLTPRYLYKGTSKSDNLDIAYYEGFWRKPSFYAISLIRLYDDPASYSLIIAFWVTRMLVYLTRQMVKNDHFQLTLLAEI